MRIFHSIFALIVCAFSLNAQTINSRYIQLADSADNFISSEKWDLAEETTIKALQEDPANPTSFILWSNLGTIRSRRGNLDGALEAFEIGLLKAPNSTALLSNRAYCLIAAGRDDEALPDLDRALELDSLLQQPLLTRGLLLLKEGRPEEARRDLMKYHQHWPEDEAPLEAIGDTYSSTCENDSAAIFYRKALDKKFDGDIAFKLSLILTDGHRFEESASLLHESMLKAPDNGNLYLARAYLRKKQLLNKESDADIQEALKYGISTDTLLTLFPSAKGNFTRGREKGEKK